MGSQHRERLRRYVALLHAFVLVSFTVVIALTGLTSDGSALPHLALAGGVAVLAMLTGVRGERPEHLVVGLTLAGFAATPAFTQAGDVSGPLVLTAVFLGAVRTLSTARAVGVVGAATLMVLLIRQATGAVVDLNLIGSCLLGVANTFVAGAFVASLERSTEAMDEAEAGAHAETLRLAAQNAHERAVDGARRVLHDEVLTALRAIATQESSNGMAARDVDERDYRVRLSATAVDALDELDLQRGSDEDPRPAASSSETETGSGADQSLETWIEGLRQGSPIPFSVHLDLAGRDWGLSPVARAAAGRAVLEALRNAHRHAGVGHAALSVVRGPDAVEISVRDQGPGMPTDRREGVGITESIRGAVAAAGGRARLTSDTDGTLVVLAFPHPPASKPGSLRRTYDLTMRAGAERELAVATMLPLSIVWVIIGFTSAMLSDAVVAQLLLLAAAGVMAAVVTSRVRRTAPTWPWLLTVTAGLLVLQVVGIASLPDGGLLDLRSWSVGFLAAPLLVLCFVLPVRVSLALIATHIALILAVTAADPGPANGALPVAALNAVIAIPAITVLLGMGLRRNAAVIERERAGSVRATSELISRRSAGEVSSLHLDHTRRVVVPWLREVAEGRVDPTTAEAVQRARLLMLETRDDLHAPGFHDPEQRRATSAYRARGGVVDIRPGFDPGAHTRLSGAVLRRLAAGLTGDHRVTVSPPGRGRRTARVVILPPPPPEVLDSLAADPRLNVSGDDIATHVDFEDDAP